MESLYEDGNELLGFIEAQDFLTTSSGFPLMMSHCIVENYVYRYYMCKLGYNHRKDIVILKNIFGK
jgi:hypothetical protein